MRMLAAPRLLWFSWWESIGAEQGEVRKQNTGILWKTGFINSSLLKIMDLSFSHKLCKEFIPPWNLQKDLQRSASLEHPRMFQASIQDVFTKPWVCYKGRYTNSWMLVEMLFCWSVSNWTCTHMCLPVRAWIDEQGCCCSSCWEHQSCILIFNRHIVQKVSKTCIGLLS